jgi:hypothetical protein
MDDSDNHLHRAINESDSSRALHSLADGLVRRIDIIDDRLDDFGDERQEYEKGRLDAYRSVVMTLRTMALACDDLD